VLQPILDSYIITRADRSVISEINSVQFNGEMTALRFSSRISMPKNTIRKMALAGFPTVDNFRIVIILIHMLYQSPDF